MNPIITFSESALSYIKKMIAKQNGIGFRLSIKKTGCSGYSYHPTIVDKSEANDVELVNEHGVKIFLDTKWSALLQNLHIDYVEEEKSGLKQKRLVFSNPKETGRCGCGESFHVE